MAKIHQLSPSQAQKIAAGEVVERPANIVKELLENALDAGATKIAVHIAKGGKRSIRVVDNGCGMSAEDAHICFNKYATSKLTHVDELSSIATFGFRGEALASIAAVSTTTLVTKEAHTDHGCRIIIADNTILETASVAANTGTDITVADIFSTLPARKKFLKTDETETHQIEQLLCAIALTHIDVEFKLYVDGSLRYLCPATDDLLKRYAQLFDHHVADHMLSMQHADAEITVRGLISHQRYQRYDRSGIYLFVNRRWIKDLKLMRALMRGYQNVLPPARFPAGVVCVELDPALLDINMHPRKEEVQFMHPRLVETAVQRAVTQCLEQTITNELHKPSVQQTHTPTPPQAAPFVIPVQSSARSALSIPTMASPTPRTVTSWQEKKISASPAQTAAEATYTQHNVVAETVCPATHSIGTVLAQLYQTYIVVEQDDALVLVDQHAAHERIIYEQLKTAATQLEPVALLFPLLINLHHGQLALLEPYLEQFKAHGIHMVAFGVDCLHVTALPVLFKDRPIDKCVQEVAAWLAEHQSLAATELADRLHDAMRQRMACAAAVKAGDLLTTEQMEHLVRTLARTPENFCCPHGRPTIWQLPRDMITKRFKRDYRQQEKY
jgi:DNA mismatch repair protein MutL